MFDVELIKNNAREMKISLAEIAEKIGYSEAGFHKALNNGTLNIRAIVSLGNILKIPLAKFVIDDDYLKVATIVSDKSKEGKTDDRWNEMLDLIDKQREYIKLTTESLLDQLKEKDNQIERLMKSMEKKDEIIHEYFACLKNCRLIKLGEAEKSMLNDNNMDINIVQKNK